MKHTLFSKSNPDDPVERLCNLRESWPGYMYFPDAINGLLKLLEAQLACDEYHVPCDAVTPENIEGLRLLIMEKFTAFLNELDEIYWDLYDAKKRH